MVVRVSSGALAGKATAGRPPTQCSDAARQRRTFAAERRGAAIEDRPRDAAVMRRCVAHDQRVPIEGLRRAQAGPGPRM